MRPFAFSRHLIALLSTLLSTLLLAACGSGSSGMSDGDSSSISSQPATSANTQSLPLPRAVIQGEATKGVIASGIVSAYSISDSNNPLELLDSARSNSQGQFELSVPESALGSQVLLQVTVDSNSTMLCDLAQGCTDPESGNWYSFGSATPLRESFQLLGMLHKNLAGTHDANISALSHLIVATALNLPDGLTTANVKQATKWVKDTFELARNPLATNMIDVTSAEAISRASESELIQSIIGAGFYDLARTESWSNAELSVNHVSSRTIIENASIIANEVSEVSSSSVQERVDSLNSLAQSQQSIQGLHIVSAPRSMSVQENESFYFRIHAESSSTLSYQWFHNGKEISGANDAVFGRLNASKNHIGNYQVRVDDGGETYYSNFAALKLNGTDTPLSIGQQPQSGTYVKDQDIHLHVALSSDAEVQWQKNGSLLTSYKGPTLSIYGAQTTDTGHYRAIISKSGTTLYSEFANIQVNDSVSPIKISEQPRSVALLAGQDGALQVLASGGGFLRYQWYKNNIQISSANTNQLSLGSLTKAHEGNYFVEVSNSVGTIRSGIANVQVINNAASLALAEQPHSAIVYEGSNHTLSVRAPDVTPYTYQWYKNGQALQGANDRDLTMYAVNNASSGIYHAVVMSALGTTTSDTANIEIRERPSVSLSWSIPTERENGELLPESEIYGYRVEYGPQYNKLSEHIDIVGPGKTQVTLSNLTYSRVYAHIATIDSDGVLGRFSPIEEILAH